MHLSKKNQRDPILFVISGPSGGGKGTIMQRVLAEFPAIQKVVNYTTRPPRNGEQDGVDYHFIDEKTFRSLQEQGKIFEAERVYNDYYYGSPSDLLDEGADRFIEVDFKGHQKLRRHYNEVVSFFVLPPSFEELERRIRQRSPEANLPARLNNAREQIAEAGDYDYLIVNDDLDVCCCEVITAIRAEQIKRKGRRFLRRLLAGTDPNND